MKLGDILVWVTDQAKGHASRRKYHIYLRDAGWRENGHAFLFVNKSDYGGDYKILKSDYDFFELEYSFISCGDIVTYTDDRLSSFAISKVGELSPAHMKELYIYIMDSEVMPQWQIDLVCDALKEHL